MEEWGTDWSRDVLARIAALLFSLAGLADRAAGLPAARRRHLLGILSVGEAEAWAFVFGMPIPADTPNETDDAARMAARLRALAMLLTVMLAQRFEMIGTVALCPDRGTPAGAAGRWASLSTPDTS